MSKAILDTAEVIHDYMRNGDRSTSREECITWIAQLIREASQHSPIVKDEVCEWKYESDNEMFDTQCNSGFSFIEGSIQDNGYVYCPHCGKRIITAPSKEEGR